METTQQTNVRLRKRLIKLADMLRRARYSADHDVLTGLPNRRLFYDRLQQAMALSARQRRRLAVLMIDLDGFKQINDTLGHASGDVVLQMLAERLMSCLRATDSASRLGGDEFAVMLPEIKGPNSVLVVIEKIRACLAEPYCVGEESLVIGASIGVTIYAGEPQPPCELLDLADQDMYRVKGLRRGKIARPRSKIEARSRQAAA